MGTRITREGVHRREVEVPADRVLAMLSDQQFVTDAMGDLLDQQRSSAAPARWVLPGMEVMGVSVEIVLLPVWQETDDRVVHIDAASDDGSDVEVELDLQLRATPTSATASELVTSWEMGLVAPVPRAMLQFAQGAIDQAIDEVVGEIVDRVATAVERGGR